VFFAPFLIFYAIAFFFVLAFFFILLEIHVINYAFVALGLPPEYAFTALLVSLVGSYTNDIAFICLNYSYPPWNLPTNRLLRQAVAYAIPYDDIVNLDYLGFARRMYSQVPSTFDGYVANMTYQTDLDKAKALMSQAELERFPEPGQKRGDFSQSYPGMFPNFRWQRAKETGVVAGLNQILQSAHAAQEESDADLYGGTPEGPDVLLTRAMLSYQNPRYQGRA